MSGRLLDPKGLVTESQRLDLETKLSDCLGKMARSTERGGNPFFYALTATKYHFLEDTLGPGSEGWETAATDGKAYFWHPKFIEKLTPSELRIVQMHENLHVVCRHPERNEGRIPELWRLAIDWYVNAAIEQDLRSSGKISLASKNGEHPIWKGNLGPPITLKEYLDRIKLLHDNPKKYYSSIKPDEKRICADHSVYGQSADDIYKTIYKQYKKYPPPKSEGDEGVGAEKDLTRGIGNMDGHISLRIPKKELIRQLLNAAESAKRMRGTIPSEIVDELKALQEPDLTWEDICKQRLQRVKERNGRLNDWTRFRRRGLSMGLYMPVKIKFNGKILVLLDTSGSMSQDDIVYVVSQLQVIDGHTTCWVVPVDAVPHWDAATEVENAAALKKIKIVGRGGTDFNEFFTDYECKMKEHGPFDLIVCLTDGYFGTIDKKLEPNCDVVWVLNHENGGFEPPFGHAAPFKRPGSHPEEEECY